MSGQNLLKKTIKYHENAMICLNENYHVKNMIVQSNFIKIEY